MLISTSRKRTQQPRGVISVNPAVAKSRGLLALVSGHGVDLLRGVPATRQAGVVFTPSASGVGSAASAFKASGNLSAGATGVSTGAVTDFVLLQGFSTAETYLYPCGTYDGSTGFAITAKHLSIGNRWGVFAGAAGLLDSGESLPTSGMHMLLVSRTVGGQFFLYRNGRFVVQRTAAVYSAAPTAPWVHGGLSSTAVDFNLATPVVLSGRFGRNLSETEIRELYENPWSLLGGEKRRIWAAEPASGTGPVGLAVESSTAFALTPAGGIPVGLASEVATASALSGKLLKPAELSTSTEAALALPGRQIKVAGLATETATAFARTAIQRRSAGAAIETNSSLVLGGKQRKLVGVAAEASSAVYVPAVTPTVAAWTGSAWTYGELKRWTGAAWEVAVLKRWNGSSWVNMQ